MFLSSESTKPDFYAADRKNYAGSLLLRALAATPEFVTISYDCKKADAEISVSVKVNLNKEIQNHSHVRNIIIL